MTYEFALEPAAITRWESLRYFADKFGMAQGRLLSRYPSTWQTMVWEGCAETTPRNRRRFELLLESLRSKLLKTGRSYDERTTWVPNAFSAHATNPFHAIITATGGHPAPALEAEEIQDDTPLWKMETMGIVPRTAVALAQLARPLLSLSTNIRFIDQHFSCTAKHGRPLARMLCDAFSGRPATNIEYHLNAQDPASEFRLNLISQLPYFNLTAKCCVDFVRWRKMDDGDNLHARYILTNRGGLRIDYGLDEGHNGETTDWHLLNETLRQRRFDQFNKGSTCFEFVDAWRASVAGVEQITDRVRL